MSVLEVEPLTCTMGLDGVTLARAVFFGLAYAFFLFVLTERLSPLPAFALAIGLGALTVAIAIDYGAAARVVAFGSGAVAFVLLRFRLLRGGGG